MSLLFHALSHLENKTSAYSVGTEETACAGMRSYRVPPRAVIVHVLKPLKLKDSLARAARAFASEMFELPSMRRF